MLYPQKLSAKKTDSIIKKGILISVIIEIILILINGFVTPQLRWARYCNIGIIYVWITVLYSINRNINTARHLFLQMILISAFSVYIDISMDFQAWSINYAIPIIIIITNIAMLILALFSENYTKYAYFQFLIIIFSLVPIFFMYEHLVNDKTLCIISTIISGINLLISIIFHKMDLQQELIRKFHI